MSTHVSGDIAKLYGRQFVIDQEDAHYSRYNVKMWLLNWHEVSQLRGESLLWTRTVADLTMAVNKLPPRLIRLFELYCVLGYTQDEVQDVFEWRHRQSFANAWSELLSRVCRILMDRTERAIPTPRKSSIGLFSHTVTDEPKVCTCRK